MQIESASGHVFYLNHLISFVITFLGGWLFFYYLKNKMKDKILHFVISGFLTFICFHICYFLNFLMIYSPVFVLCIGIIKEFVDKFNKKKKLFDFYDLIANVSGISVVSLVYLFSFEL